MARLGVLFAACVLWGCAAARGPALEIERYRGVMSTHFDGVPDRVEICAVLVNRGGETLRWSRLRLRSWSTEGSDGGGRTSDWLWQGTAEPGRALAVSFPDAPPTQQIELRVLDSGAGRAPLRGRALLPAGSCSEPDLAAELVRANEGRSAPGIQIIPLIRRSADSDS